MNPILPLPMFPGISDAQVDFNSTRQALRAKPFCVMVDLSVARDVNSMLNLPIAGNVFYIDQRANTGTARIHFQDQTPLGCPITVFAGFLAEIPFTQIAIENDAQPGQWLQIIFGTDLKFIPSNAAGISLLNPVSVIDGARQSTALGISYMAYCDVSATAAKQSHAQLFNPAGSGKVLVVDTLTLSVGGASGIFIGYKNSPLVSAAGTLPTNKKSAAGAPVSVAQSRVDQNAVSQIDTFLGKIVISPSVVYSFSFKRPVILYPNTGLVALLDTVNIALWAMFEYLEDAA